MHKSSEDKATITPLFLPDSAVVRFHGDVTEASIFNLCDVIDTIFNYYHYNTVTIEIESDGGAVSALLYYCSKLEEWRNNDNIIETLALTRCCSAAAFILSLGNIGHRSARESCKLLYHNARLGLQDDHTTDSLEKIYSDLKKTDEQLHNILIGHISKPEIEAENLKNMMKKDDYIKLEEAKRYELIDHIKSTYCKIK